MGGAAINAIRNAGKHPKLVNALQARMLALQGRGGDTEVAHLTPGEVVLPRSLQTPELMKHIASLAARQGINPARLAVGHRANSINPTTGQREFEDDRETILVTGTDRPQVIDRFDPLGSQWGGYNKYEQSPNRNSADGGPEWGGLNNPEDVPPIINDPNAPEVQEALKDKKLDELIKMRDAAAKAAIKVGPLVPIFNLGSDFVVRYYPELRGAVAIIRGATAFLAVSITAFLTAIQISIWQTQQLMQEPEEPI